MVEECVKQKDELESDLYSKVIFFQLGNRPLKKIRLIKSL